MLRIITYNCYNIKNSIQDICDLCNSYDLIFLQEIWLFQHELPLLSNICSDFEGFGTTAMDISNGIMSGRPYGGVAVLVRKSIRKECQVHMFDDSRLLGITVNTSDMPCYFLNVYMPYQCDNNYDLFVEYIGKISSIIEESVTSNVIILGDFNAAVDTVFESELLEMCKSHQLFVSDYAALGRDSGQYTYVSDAHCTTSWLDHVLCSQDLQRKLQLINILDKLPSSDHLPLSVIIDVRVQSVPSVSTICSSPRAKVIYNWTKADTTDVNNYCMKTYDNFSKICIPPAIKCTNINCKSLEHRHEIDLFYSQICEALHCSSLDSIPSSKSSDCRNYIVPGFNDYVKDLHSVARSDYVVWRDAGKPRSGTPCSNMRRSRLQFKYALRQCRMNEEAIRADKYAKSLLDKDMLSFWKHIRKSNNARVPLATTIGGITGENEIAEMWQDHYKSILNSVKTNSRQQFVTSKLSSIRGESILFSTSDINVALHSLKSGKSCGVDGLAAEHFLFAHRITHVFLSILFNTFILHGYLPADFMKTAIVPIIKNKTGDTSDKNNYRPIALVTAASKLFEICILEILETYLITHDHQFGFKAKHSTDMCIFTVKTLVKYYTDQMTPVYTCLLDASKAFDRVNHWTLFAKLIETEAPLLIVRVLLFWYQKQQLCIKWGKSCSTYFTICNGVRQGGILSPRLFALYVNQLTNQLIVCKEGCYFNDMCINHVLYADDICLLAPTASAMQTLLDVCYEYGIDNDILFNPIKSVCTVFKPKAYKLYLPTVFIGSDALKFIKESKYLGFTFNDSKSDDCDMLRQMRLLYAKSNKLLRTFSHCSTDVKITLFQSYCTALYCPYLWNDYKKSTFSKIRVAFNNAYRKIFGLPKRSSASTMYANNNICNFETTLRKNTFGFMQRLEQSTNTIITTLYQSWIVRFDIWNTWIKSLYTT